MQLYYPLLSCLRVRARAPSGLELGSPPHSTPLKLRDAWRVATLRLPSTTTTTTAATTTAAAAAAAAATTTILPLGTSGVQLRPLPASRSSGNLTPYLTLTLTP